MTGVSLVFVHGWASSPDIWSNQKEYFSQNYNVLLPDISPAFNLSGASGIIKDSLGQNGNYIFIGWSLGWLAILESVKELKLRPAALVSVCSTAKFTNDGYLGKAGIKRTHLLKMMRDIKRNPKKAFGEFCKNMLFDSNQRDYTACMHIKEPDYASLIYGLDMLMNADYRDFLKSIDLPTLIIGANADRICPPGASIYMHSQIQNSDLKIFNCGHMPFLDKRDEFNSALDSFIYDKHI